MLIDIMQKRINEIKQQDRKAYYEIANEIGISEYSLYSFVTKNEYSQNTQTKIKKYLKDYKTKDEQIEQWKHEYEVLDACCELAQGKIAELKAENEKLASWLESSEKEKKELCNVIHKRKEQIQTLKYMLFDEKEIPKDKFTMYYRIAQNERRTKSHRDLCTNIVKKYKQTLQKIKKYIAKICKEECGYVQKRDVLIVIVDLGRF